MQEHAVKTQSYIPVLVRISLFATLISAIQTFFLEAHAIVYEIEWTLPAVLFISGFVLALFTLYSLAPVMLQRSTASTFNLSLLTADFYGAVAAVVFFHSTFSLLYGLAFSFILCGLVIYNLPQQAQHVEILTMIDG
jgi:solute carrier family 35 protein F1/2